MISLILLNRYHLVVIISFHPFILYLLYQYISHINVLRLRETFLDFAVNLKTWAAFSTSWFILTYIILARTKTIFDKSSELKWNWQLLGRRYLQLLVPFCPAVAGGSQELADKRQAFNSLEGSQPLWRGDALLGVHVYPAIAPSGQGSDWKRG